jgi:hypothetical protein
VYAKHFSVDNSGQRKEVENLAAGLPYGSVTIFGLAFLVETIDLGDLSRFVVSTDECDAVREPVSISMSGDVLPCSSLTLLLST